MDYAAIANQVVEYLKPLAAPAGNVAISAAGSAVWDWVKARLPRRSAGAAESVAAVVKSPASVADWEVLKGQLRKALEEDEGFRRELLALLPKEVLSPRLVQAASVPGSNSVVIQSAGSGSINVQR